MKDRLCWEDQGAQHVLCDRKTGFTMGRLELKFGLWTFSHQGRVMGSCPDKEEAETLGFTIIQAFLIHNEALRLKATESANSLLDEAFGPAGAQKPPQLPKE